MKVLAAIMIISFSASFASAKSSSNVICNQQNSGGLLAKTTFAQKAATKMPASKGGQGAKRGRQ